MIVFLNWRFQMAIGDFGLIILHAQLHVEVVLNLGQDIVTVRTLLAVEATALATIMKLKVAIQIHVQLVITFSLNNLNLNFKCLARFGP